MSGVSRQPILRFTPPAGLARVIDLSTDLTYLPGPARCAVSPGALETTKRQDPNRVDRPRRYGVRPVVSLTLIDGGDMIDTPLIQELAALLFDDEMTAEVTVDGGVHWFGVWLSKFTRSDLKDKQFTGQQWDIELTATTPMTDVAALL